MVRMMRREEMSVPRSSTKRSSAKAARAAAAPPAASYSNGLEGFAIHAEKPAAKKALRSASRAMAGPATVMAAAAPAGMAGVDPETAARHHLDAALASDNAAVRRFVRPVAGGATSEFKTISVEGMPLTGTTLVKFRQTVNKVPVYGSLVTVELDEDHDCLGINSALGTPDGVQHIATIAPAAALKAAAKDARVPLRSLTNTPRLHYYFDDQTSQWQLAYVIESVPQKSRTVLDDGRADAVLKDYVVDAHSGKLIAALPRTPTLSRQEIAVDGLQGNRTIEVEVNGTTRQLRNATLNVRTCDFNFDDPSAHDSLLPGALCALPPKPFLAAAVSAHANTEDVARFLRDVLKRNNIDGRGGEMISTVNCWDRQEGTRPAKQWKNAYWNGRQMVYGQIAFPNAQLFSVANMLDIVGHEIFHGVTDHSCRLEYRTQQGALNESYSDIFGVIIANRTKPLKNWSWKIGSGFDGPGSALRDLEDPTRHGQPKHMRDFRPSRPPYTFEGNDYGFVHDNSGIHNFAAFRIMTAKSGTAFLFKADELAALFYIALTMQLSARSQFADSRRGVVQAARTLFRNDAPATRDAKIRAVEAGFTAAGI